MVYRGRVEKGVILLDEPVKLPEGTEVDVSVRAPSIRPDSEAQVPTLFEQLHDVIGKAQGLPTDLAENHDFYLHGLQKR